MGFEHAREALESSISEGGRESTNERAPESSPQTESIETAGGSEQATKEEAIQAAIVELDKLEKFKYRGKEWTPKDLEAATLRQSDYTKKTQELAQERRFVENLPYDLMAVSRDPAKASQFKQVYPEKFHQFLEDFLSSNQTNPQSQGVPQAPQGNQYQSLDPSIIKEFNSLKGIVHELQSGWKQTEAEKSEAQ